MSRAKRSILALLAATVVAHAEDADWVKAAEITNSVPGVGSVHAVGWINSKTIRKDGTTRTYDVRMSIEYPIVADGKTSTVVSRMEMNATLDCERQVYVTNSLKSTAVSIDGVENQAAASAAKAAGLSKIGQAKKLATLSPEMAWVCKQ